MRFVTRQLAPDSYWHLRHLSSEARAAYIAVQHAQELFNRAKLTEQHFMEGLGLNGQQAYTFLDDVCMVQTQEPAKGPVEVPKPPADSNAKTLEEALPGTAMLTDPPDA